ncbi:hypothetical protein MPC1_3810004 [Methylocella tundrae]|nr:hypothetical protein MPC1_3810004 [Methylocella tundrae]
MFDKAAFAEDCGRADIIVTPLFAPAGCAAGLVIDRDELKETGAITLLFTASGVARRAARTPDEDRPWSPAPRRKWGPSSRPFAASRPTRAASSDLDPSSVARAAGEAPGSVEDEDGDASPLE